MTRQTERHLQGGFTGEHVACAAHDPASMGHKWSSVVRAAVEWVPMGLRQAQVARHVADVRGALGTVSLRTCAPAIAPLS